MPSAGIATLWFCGGGPAGCAAALAFLYDAGHNDGSYDAVFGPNFREPEGAVRIIRDFIPPRK